MVRFSTVFASLLLVVACAPPTTVGGRGSGGGGSRGGSECVNHSECEFTQRCDNGFCVANDCANDSDCVGGQVCRNNLCEDGGEACQDIRDCPAGQVCDNNQCVPQGTACTGDGDCDRGEVCSNGRCAPGDGTCTSEAQCADGQSCVNGRCLTTGGDECIRSSDCPNGQICDNNRCVDQNSCGSDRDCNVGQACIGGQCTDVGGGACTTHSNCGPGEACEIQAGQANGTCRSLSSLTCGEDSDCELRDGNGDRAIGDCNNGRCAVGEFGNCTQDNQCAGTFSCVTAGQRQLCLQRCQDNSVCGAISVCNEQINACYYNLCGSPAELSASFQDVNNGRLGGACNADGTNDGTCVEVSAGANEWVGLCVEGGTAQVGASCLFDTNRSDNGNQCVGGATCHFNNDRDRGTCVATCSTDHGSVRCSGATTCLAGRCLTNDQICDPGAADSCGFVGRCALLGWETDDGICTVQDRNTVGVGAACDDSSQCTDGSVCLNLGQGNTCVALCRPGGGGQACGGGTTCQTLASLSNNQIGGNWGLCVAP